MERVIVLGASRGLGRELIKHLSALGISTFGFARKNTDRIADFASPRGQDEVIRFLLEENYSKVICVAGGGPYGRFEDRAWKDHQWAFEVTFQFQARLIHALLAAKRTDVQAIFVGSRVAESQGDPNAASYCAAKHALKGLILSLRAENPNWDIRLFSPGYMDTDMLPANAAVRKLGVYNPANVAKELWTWSLNADGTGHKVYPPHPN